MHYKNKNKKKKKINKNKKKKEKERDTVDRRPPTSTTYGWHRQTGGVHSIPSIETWHPQDPCIRVKHSTQPTTPSILTYVEITVEKNDTPSPRLSPLPLASSLVHALPTYLPPGTSTRYVLVLQGRSLFTRPCFVPAVRYTTPSSKKQHPASSQPGHHHHSYPYYPPWRSVLQFPTSQGQLPPRYVMTQYNTIANHWWMVMGKRMKIDDDDGWTRKIPCSWETGWQWLYSAGRHSVWASVCRHWRWMGEGWKWHDDE